MAVERRAIRRSSRPPASSARPMLTRPARWRPVNGRPPWLVTVVVPPCELGFDGPRIRRGGVKTCLPPPLLAVAVALELELEFELLEELLDEVLLFELLFVLELLLL